MTWSIPGYTADRLLGSGGTGEVWAGREDATGEPVALKRLRVGGGELDRKHLRREGALLAAFRHPHVISLRGVLGTDQGPVLVLDLAEGGSLAGVLAGRERLRSGQVVALLAPIGEALADAHAAGLLHGDVSPGNVLLDRRGGPLLADLGTGRLVGDEAEPAHGTSGYVDPAVRHGAAPSSASDVYSLGALAARALTGHPVAEGSDGVQQWADHAHALGVPSAVAMVICAGLSAQPSRRPSAAAFAEQLRASCPSEPLGELVVRVEPPIGPESLTRRVARPAPVAPEVEPIRWWRRLLPPRRAGSPGRPPAAELAEARAPAARSAEPRPAAARSAESWPVARSAEARAPAARSAEPRPVARSAESRPAAEWSRIGGAGGPVAGGPVAGGPVPGWRWARPSASVVRRLTLLVVAVALAAVGGVAWAGFDSPSDGGSAPPSSAGEWPGVLGGLDARREQAFAHADVAALDEVYTPHSAALATDRRAIAALTAAHATAAGVRHELRAVRTISTAPDRVELEIADRMPPYRVVDGGGTLRTVAARGERRFRVTLVRTAGAGWRIDAITESR